METLEALHRQIDNITDMRSVVSTMKTLAAVSIRQYEAAVDALADYDRTVRMGFQILFRDRGLPPEAVRCGGGVRGAIVFGSDQGMCGQFNDRIVEATLKALESHGVDRRAASLLVVGSRAGNRLADAGCTVDRLYRVPVSADDILRLVQEMLPNIQRWQSQKRLARLLVFFNRHRSASSYEPRQRQLLPLSRDQIRHWQAEPWPSRSLPTFTMEPSALFSAVARQYLFVSLYRACAESLASENASRIASMQAAEKNIEERLDELRMRFHQQRQTSITEELLDVVTGFEAISGRDDNR